MAAAVVVAGLCRCAYAMLCYAVPRQGVFVVDIVRRLYRRTSTCCLLYATQPWREREEEEEVSPSCEVKLSKW